MLELQEKENNEIFSMIYEINGKQVMLDSDLANLYQCKNGTKEINQAVKNNIEKFPKRFSWVLSEEEQNILRSKILTTNKRRYNYRVFTEQGVAMLATILKSSIATQVSIAIMDAFVLMRKYISSNLLEQKYISNQVMKNAEDIRLLQESFKHFNNTKPENEIFFKGQIYDAYSLLIDILNIANKNIIIIDNYIDKTFLDICSKIKVNIIIYTSKIDKNDMNKYNEQYKNVQIRFSNSFHDRFIIIDNKILYHSGASFKDLGKKCFAINRIESNDILREILKILN